MNELNCRIQSRLSVSVSLHHFYKKMIYPLIRQHPDSILIFYFTQQLFLSCLNQREKLLRQGYRYLFFRQSQFHPNLTYPSTL